MQTHSEEQKDDGVRFKCCTCGDYLTVDDVDEGMRCDACRKLFVVCGSCGPDDIPDLAVWVCPECR
jgi:hypothetical protein